MEAILETRDLTVAFDGHIAVNGVNFKVPQNHFKSIIGPNGAGKTTLFNLLSGQLKPTKGQILFKGREITTLPPHLRTRLGIGRSFQITNVYPNLTVLENVRLAVQAKSGIWFNTIFHYKKFDHEEKAHHWLKMVLLDHKSLIPAKNLTHGEKRKLELAMLLALETEILLLDEPTAGMSLEEVPVIIDLIQKIKEEGNKTIVLIEHKIDLVLDLSDSVMVLFNGKILADGTPHEIMSNELVQSAYLGGLYDGGAS